MTRKPPVTLGRWFAAMCLAVVNLGAHCFAQDIPQFVVDASWPKPLPNRWLLGEIGGIAVDKHDHIWVYQRPRSLTDDERGAAVDPPISKCCIPAPAVLEFDKQGYLLQAWGGPGAGYEWPKREHGISVDAKDHVWIGGNDKDADHHILKFTREGKFVLQIGKSGRNEGSNSHTSLGRPALAIVDDDKNEVYVADGYGNRRIIVFDATSGEYKRHWGAYGKTPEDKDLGAYNPDAPMAEQFRTPVHCVRIAKDGLVYVCDRVNNRIQIFHKEGRFVTEFILAPRTRFVGSVWDVALSEDSAQKYLYVADGTNNEIHILARADGKELATFGRSGRNAGDFHWVHAMAIDSEGNLYTGEVDNGKRVQKFIRKK